MHEPKRKPESPTKLSCFLIITRGNDTRMRIHKHMDEKIEKPETLLSRVRFSLTIAPVFSINSFKKDKGKFSLKGKTLSDRRRSQEKQFSISLFTA
ncbi:hypothetical protein H3S80_08830 [Bartonella sp. M0177]|uniref:hypothetical protein n=1 Tax=Bartonella sp. M0177 TaxID=2750940 RepID=UPI0018DC32FA|nr:hypothetical protein [Bartonella sp. M0177]MBI0004149.1 hypothetical protein [Bartonella sp. M0177]